MGEVASSRVGLTRRSFLKTAGAAGALGLAGAAGMTSSSNWLAPREQRSALRIPTIKSTAVVTAC